MNQLIGLLLPSIIAVHQIEILYPQKKFSKQQIIYIYLKYILYVNLISYMITIYIFRQTNFIFTNQFTFKYSILSMSIAYLLPIILRFLKDNINIYIVVEKNEK